MECITPASKTVLSILNNLKKSELGDRLFKYCATASVNDGILVYNVLTREMVFLTEEEYNNLESIEYLRSNWFLVPDQTDDKAYVDLIKQFLVGRQNKLDKITGYTIFTTTDCNARCFYCFELGRSRVHMTKEIALKLVEYIKNHCGGEEVTLKWFGGEPLYNYEVIDVICEGLRKNGISYVSHMTSNGYLFNDELVQKAVSLWNVKMVQITLDGTEEIYNKVKAYIHRGSNAYQVVMSNISRLLKASVDVYIRLNMDLHNCDDLLILCNELSCRFGGNKHLSVYAHHLFKDGVPIAQLHTEDEWILRDEAMRKIETILEENGLSSNNVLSNRLKLFHCMADCGYAVTILPDGNIGLCEHYTESEFIGHIDKEGFDTETIASWKMLSPQIPECADCIMYPECVRLSKCTNASVCYAQYRSDYLRKTKRKMIASYEAWLNNKE